MGVYEIVLIVNLDMSRGKFWLIIVVVFKIMFHIVYFMETAADESYKVCSICQVVSTFRLKVHATKYLVRNSALCSLFLFVLKMCNIESSIDWTNLLQRIWQLRISTVEFEFILKESSNRYLMSVECKLVRCWLIDLGSNFTVILDRI